ncbi:MAG: NADH-quinone oxidoreductase subunit NuoE [Candidatus Omnitrophota bacterium]|jgi:NADH-quinone oxidoreductase subunit E/NADP-reducing hydrogenase subunit HndA
MCSANNGKQLALRAFMDNCKEKAHPESNLISILHKAQELYGYLSKEVMDDVATRMNIPTAHIWGVATFYHYFNLKPKGKHTVSICLGTACYVKGADQILDAIREELMIDVGQTSEDDLFTLQEARCLGTCGLAPVVMIDEKIYGNLTPKKTIEILQGYKKAAGKYD